MRPLPLLAVAFVTGAFAAALEPAPAPAVLGLAALGVGVLAATGAERLTSAVARRSCASLLVLGAATAGWVAGRPAPSHVPPPGEFALDAIVERSAREPRPWAVLRARSATDRRGHALPRGARVRLLGRAPPVGTRVAGTVTLRPERPYRNPTPHPPWPSTGAVVATARAAPGELTVRELDAPRSWLDDARDAVRANLAATLRPRAAAMARALVLGEGRAVANADRAAVRDAGLAHVLAVSGLHVTIVAGLFVVGARAAMLRLPLLARRVEPTRVACALGIGCALSFAAFAGGAPSAWRAAITAALGWGLRAAGRRPDPVPVAGAAALLLAAVDPTDVVRPGFLLSIVATAAVITTGRPAEPSPWAWARTALAISTRTTLATAPVVLWCFGAVPVVGVVANVVLVPVGSLLLVPLAVMHAAAATLVAPLAELTGPAFERAAAAFVAACRAFAALGPSGAWPPPSVAQGVVIGAACLGLLVGRRVRVCAAIAAVALVALAAGEVGLRAAERPRGVLRATFLDVGQGDAALFDMPDGRLVLVDAGGTRGASRDPGARVLVPLLRARRRDRVDVAVLTHAHPDHYRGLDAVLRALPVGELWDNGQVAAERRGGAADRLLHRTGSVLRPKSLCTRPRRFGRATLRVLWPCPAYDPGFDLNDNSFVLRVSLGRRAFLLAGDVEALAEGALVERGADLGADVLKVAHHGSRTSSTTPFLAAVDPGVAVVSAGTGNPFGHPHPEVIARLQRTGARVIRLDEHGGVIVETDGESLSVR